MTTKWLATALLCGLTTTAAAQTTRWLVVEKVPAETVAIDATSIMRWSGAVTIWWRARPAARLAAAPAIIVVEGSLLRHRAVLANGAENLRLFTSLSPPMPPPEAEAQRASFSQRPFVDLWLFWGAKWQWLAIDTAMVRTVKTKDADEHGRFYPARGKDPAVMELDGAGGVPPSIQSAPSAALAVFEAHGIPKRI